MINKILGDYQLSTLIVCIYVLIVGFIISMIEKYNIKEGIKIIIVVILLLVSFVFLFVIAAQYPL